MSQDDKPSLFDVVRSVLMAFLGVQSGANRERDFTRGNAGVFIAVGVVLTLMFLVAVYAVVQLALPD